jgi:hypothetical protein
VRVKPLHELYFVTTYEKTRAQTHIWGYEGMIMCM